jgi:hypothetical protein
MIPGKIVRAGAGALLAVLSSAGVNPLAAQRAVYSHPVGDTLRFHDVTKMDGVVHGAAGDAPFTLSRDATISFAFGTGQSVQAWYDALTVDASGALGGSPANAESLLHAPFLLHMEPNGRMQTLHSPTFPRTMRLIAEVPPQLDDFFPRLPASGSPALKVGTTWTDTITHIDNDTAGRRFSNRRITHYRYDRDTLVAGRPAAVITLHSEFRIESSSPMQQQPYIADLALHGTEDGTALFSIAQGRLLSRERSGESHGTVTYKGGDDPWVVNQSYHFHRLSTAVERGSAKR